MKNNPVLEQKQKFVELINKKVFENLNVYDIIDELEISKATYYRWLIKYQKGEIIQKDISTEMLESRSDILRSLRDKACQGNLKAIQMYLKNYGVRDEDPEENLTPDEMILRAKERFPSLIFPGINEFNPFRANSSVEIFKSTSPVKGMGSLPENDI